MIAGPDILLRPDDHASSHGIEFYIPVTLKQVVLRINGAGFMAAFPEGTGATVLPINVLSVTTAYNLHQIGDAILKAWSNQQMNMICHEAISMKTITIKR